MIKIIYLVFFLFFLNNCSFDNKTGIWTGSDKIAKKKDNNKENLEFIFKKDNQIIQEKELSSKNLLALNNPVLFSSWSQQYQNKFNYIGNVSYNNKGNYKKFSKISRSEVNKNIIVHKNNLFFSDDKGNIGIFSFTRNQLIFKFNFYKKKFKNTKKNIKLILNGNFIIAADNFGYIYSIDYKKNKLNWAKNFLVPFRSNLKIKDKTLYLSDEKNKIILVNIENGKKIDELYTQPSKAVSKFESNIALDKNNNLVFLSTNGSLYSINFTNQKNINWIQNFKPENEIIFNGNPINIFNDQILISTNNNISLININGKKLWNLNIESSILPVISGNTIFTINKDNYLIFIQKDTGEIVYTKNIHALMQKDFTKKFQRKIKKIEHIFLADNKLLLISNNSYFVELNIKNIVNIISIKKNPFDISSDLIFLKDEMIFVSNSKRIYKVN